MPQTLTPYWQEHLGEDWEEAHQFSANCGI
ncbi:hypothetical protein KHA80_07445 [Anaerobacillus sp. HL2]|nr:hypothetical protein KHA80_07445 [Anaerobacillus sp. HL2]